MEIDTTTLIDDYFACWNSTGDAERAAAVARTWTEDATSTDPANAVAGHDELTAMFAASQEAFPGHRFRQVGGADHHHQLLRWGWEMLDPEGATVLDGIDVAIVADDGRLSALAGFFGAQLPAAEAASCGDRP